jgi:hypothetical protein
MPGEETTIAEETETEESKSEKYHRETVAELITKRHEVREAESVHESKKLEAKNAKINLEAKQERMNRLVDQLEDIENGNYQPMLDFPEDDPVDDPAGTTSIEDLGIPDGQTEKLLGSEIETVADLEVAIKDGKIQHISGIGPAAIDKITDIYMAWRNSNPMPIVDDDPEPADDEAGGETVTEKT